MKNITDIYEKYKIMPLLAMHQIRVAAVAMMICDSLSVLLDKDSIIKACLIHDIGNIIKFDLNHFPEHNEPQGIEYWEQVKNEYINKYGNDEHVASVKIAKELHVSQFIIELVTSVNSSFIIEIKNGDDLAKKICNYADNRVTPHGVTSIKERNLEAKERYKNHIRSFDDESNNLFIFNMEMIEKQIFYLSNIKPEDINDESVSEYIEKVKNLEI